MNGHDDVVYLDKPSNRQLAVSVCTKERNNDKCVLHITVLTTEENTWHQVPPWPVALAQRMD